MAQPVKYKGTPNQTDLTKWHSPDHGEHTAMALKELAGFTDAEVTDLMRPDGAAPPPPARLAASTDVGINSSPARARRSWRRNSTLPTSRLRASRCPRPSPRSRPRRRATTCPASKTNPSSSRTQRRRWRPPSPASLPHPPPRERSVAWRWSARSCSHEKFA